MSSAAYVVDRTHICWKQLLDLCDSYSLAISLGVFVLLHNNMSLLITKILPSCAYSHDFTFKLMATLHLMAC